MADLSKAPSADLRIRVLAVVEAGAQHRQAVGRLCISAGSVGRWRVLAQERGAPRPGPLRGHLRSGRIEAQGALIRALLGEPSDIAVGVRRAALAERGHAFGYGTLPRVFRRHGKLRKRREARRDCGWACPMATGRRRTLRARRCKTSLPG